MEDLDVAVEAARRALYVAIELSLPVMAAGMLAALVVSVAQAITRIEEQTLSLIPKLAVMCCAAILLLPWLLGVATEYARDVLGSLVSAAPPP
jgi:flagellar biosynthetic protein FliQ